MLDVDKTLPKDPDKLRQFTALLLAEVKSQAVLIEKLKKELAGHRKARFGSKSEAMDQLAFDPQEDIEIAAAAQKTASAEDADETLPPSAPTIVRRCPTILNARKKCSRPAMLVTIVAACSGNSART